jgi:tetratricopeptide (TPR) repeat protein
MDFGPIGAVLSSKVKQIRKPENTADLFARGVELEGHPSTHDEAIQIYLRVLDADPAHAAAHINLGTLFYNRQNFEGAEFHYRAAVGADPRYALAYFDLGNVLDETGRIPDAVVAYKTAINLAPTYADAHYNVALAYERLQQPRQALLHWQAYVKLDRSGPWSVHARNQISRILAADKLKVVYKRSK